MDAVHGNLAREVANRVKDRVHDIAGQIAQGVGEPIDASKLKRDEVARLWNLENPQYDPIQVQQLMMAGQHSQAMDVVYPWRNKLLGRGSPQQRVDRANQFARWASGQMDEEVSLP